MKRSAMRLILLTLLTLLSGCLGALVDVKYDEKMQPMSCHAAYWSIARDVTGAQFNVCGASASSHQAATADVVSQVVEGAVRAVLK